MAEREVKARASFTVTKVYITHKPISINCPSLPKSATQNSVADGKQLTEIGSPQLLKRIPRVKPEEGKTQK